MKHTTKKTINRRKKQYGGVGNHYASPKLAFRTILQTTIQREKEIIRRHKKIII